VARINRHHPGAEAMKACCGSCGLVWYRCPCDELFRWEEFPLNWRSTRHQALILRLAWDKENRESAK
jgi:hypothetical protein